jgi:hypothetical protein
MLLDHNRVGCGQFEVEPLGFARRVHDVHVAHRFLPIKRARHHAPPALTSVVVVVVIKPDVENIIQKEQPIPGLGVLANCNKNVSPHAIPVDSARMPATIIVFMVHTPFLFFVRSPVQVVPTRKQNFPAAEAISGTAILSAKANQRQDLKGGAETIKH